jgi:hypothetical protein
MSEINTTTIFYKSGKGRRFFLSFILVIIVLLGFWLIVNGWRAYQVYKHALDGKRNLEQAALAFNNKDLLGAINFASSASSDFKEVSQAIESSRNDFIIRIIPALRKQLEDAAYLAKTAEILSRSLNQSLEIGQKVTKALGGELSGSFADFTAEEKKMFMQTIYQSGPELYGLRANLNLALLNLEQTRDVWLFGRLPAKVVIIKQELEEGIKALNKIIPLYETLPLVFGYPDESSFLVMMQNQNELRPTGGFLGTYGILTTKDGDIKELKSEDIYHLDMPVKDKIKVEPPAPLKKYLGVNYWYLRDANWSPDWPTAAQKIIWFFKEENRLANQPQKDLKIQGVLGITPELVIDLLTLVGPIKVGDAEYNQNNFYDLLQYKVEISYYDEGIRSWDRKNIIGDVLKELQGKLKQLPAKKWPELLALLNKNLEEKDIIIYLSDADLQKTVISSGLGGEIKQINSDYLMVVDANMAALKTDAVMEKNISYELKQDNNDLLARVAIRYKHNGGFDWKTTRYRSYTRIYVPQGSKLNKVFGSDGSQESGQENNKTYFGAFVSIEPGESGELIFEYSLPEEIKKLIASGNYSLYLQKQAGNRQNIGVYLVLNKPPTSCNYNCQINKQGINWNFPLRSDQILSFK